MGEPDTEPGGSSCDGLADRTLPSPGRRAHLFRRDRACIPGDHFEKDGSQSALQQPDALGDQSRSAAKSLKATPVAAPAPRPVLLDRLITAVARRTPRPQPHLS